jgi:hypothetical protein
LLRQGYQYPSLRIPVDFNCIRVALDRFTIPYSNVAKMYSVVFVYPSTDVEQRILVYQEILPEFSQNLSTEYVRVGKWEDSNLLKREPASSQVSLAAE